MSLLDARVTPPPEALSARPYDVLEIDAHPDRARLWATIIALRAEAEALAAREHDEGYRAGYDACYNGGLP